jgi:hypothetical protein
VADAKRDRERTALRKPKHCGFLAVRGNTQRPRGPIYYLVDEEAFMDRTSLLVPPKQILLFSQVLSRARELGWTFVLSGTHTDHDDRSHAEISKLGANTLVKRSTD